MYRKILNEITFFVFEILFILVCRLQIQTQMKVKKYERIHVAYPQ